MMHNRPEVNPTRLSIQDAEETLHAIRQGAVDAFVVEEPEGHRVYTLASADLPYSSLVERMQQGAAMLNAGGDIVYCNSSLADLLGVPHATVCNIRLQDFLDPSDQPRYRQLLNETLLVPSEGEMRLRHADGHLICANFSFTVLSGDQSTFGLLVTDLTAKRDHDELSARLLRVQDEERRQLARELHDSVGQLLASISMNISRVHQESHKLSPDVAKLVGENAALVEEVSKEIRTISHLLHPPLLEIAGLASAVRWYADGFSERSKIKVDLAMPSEFHRLSSDMEIAIFRIVQECFTNIHRHSGSKSCTLTMTQEEQRLRLEIRDFGQGIPKGKRSGSPSSAGVGLRGIQERLQHLGGTLEIDSTEHGTTVIAVLPVPQSSSD